MVFPESFQKKLKYGGRSVHDLDGATSWSEKPDVVMVMRGGYDERRDKGSTDVQKFTLTRSH